MDNYFYADKEFNATDTDKIELFIQLSNTNLSATAFDTEKNKFMAFRFRNFSEKVNEIGLCKKLSELFEEDDLLKLKFNKINFMQTSGKIVLVPAKFFDVAYIKNYFAFSLPLLRNEEIQYKYTPQNDVYHLFTLNNCFINLLKQKAEEVQLYHHSMPFINNALLKLKEESKEKNLCTIHIYDNLLEIAAFSNNKLLLYNTYQYQANSDLVYFVLNVYNQLQFNPETDELLLSGMVRKNTELFKLLSKYIKKIEFDILDGTYLYSESFDIYEHIFTTLFNLKKCE